MIKNTIYLLCLILIMPFYSFAQKSVDKKAVKIIQMSVEAHGGKKYQNMDISFDFRQFRFRIKNNMSLFEYERTTQDSLKNTVRDVLNNAGFTREINGKKQTLSSKDEDKYREGVNSVAYFMMLPFKLTDAGAHLAHIGTIKIGNQEYDKIKVWFSEEGGGKDHEDVFCYWINQKTHTLDYLAYANGGPRFRKATKRETVNGIIFQDYDNYQISDKTIPTSDYDKVFIEGKAKLLSKIEQTNYKVN